MGAGFHNTTFLLKIYRNSVTPVTYLVRNVTGGVYIYTPVTVLLRRNKKPIFISDLYYFVFILKPFDSITGVGLIDL